MWSLMTCLITIRYRQVLFYNLDANLRFYFRVIFF
nr:MAG TPA: hypothetical protein [Caudoviricetes sp.]